jgi:hypothetical protein
MSYEKYKRGANDVSDWKGILSVHAARVNDHGPA